MLQFRLRSLFGMILVAATLLGIAQTAGYFVATGIVAAMLVLVWAIAWRRRGAYLYLRIGAGVLALAAIWFLAVDLSWFVEHCSDCNNRKDIAHYRVLGIPIHTRVYECQDTAEVILEDLGVPCEHANCEHWHKYRYWGLVFLAFPSINDIHLYDGNDQYTDAIAVKVRQWGAENPQQAKELHDLIVRKHDYATFWQKVDELLEATGDSRSGFSPSRE